MGLRITTVMSKPIPKLNDPSTETPKMLRSWITIESADSLEDIDMAQKRLDPIHPGEILREDFMAPLELSAHALALELRVPATRIGEIVRGRRSITPDTALRLARYFDTTPDLWLGLQTEYDLRTAKRSIGSRVLSEVRPRQARRPPSTSPVI